MTQEGSPGPAEAAPVTEDAVRATNGARAAAASKAANSVKPVPQLAGIEISAPAVNGTTVMLLGSGELARELAISFQRLGADVVVVDTGEGGPAHTAADRSVVDRKSVV